MGYETPVIRCAPLPLRWHFSIKLFTSLPRYSQGVCGAPCYNGAIALAPWLHMMGSVGSSIGTFSGVLFGGVGQVVCVCVGITTCMA